MLAPQSPGAMIRALRLSRRLSQEELAHRAEVSTRHLSCLETGRARPSHSMLLVLGAALDLPLRERNMLLVAAGFTPVYRTSTLQEPGMQHVEQAIRRILELHEPHPALLLDRGWNLLRLNGGAKRLFTWLGLSELPTGPVNVHRLVFDPAFGLRRFLVNFDAIADTVLERLRAEVAIEPTLQELLQDLVRLRGETARRTLSASANVVALPVHLRKDEIELRYFTTLTTLGAPLDVTAQELRIEGYFPLDAATARYAQAGFVSG